MGEDIFEMANNLCVILDNIGNDALATYIGHCVSYNDYASEEGFEEFLKNW